TPWPLTTKRSVRICQTQVVFTILWAVVCLCCFAWLIFQVVTKRMRVVTFVLLLILFVVMALGVCDLLGLGLEMG
ncbi:hypothetical protein, partial [uncultured Parasutterella sp.]|uniref:hypothetical protein n=1 Tax=uncultured Parasutterella sp. TaxID=1263098 RepID=UPI00272D5427